MFLNGFPSSPLSTFLTASLRYNWHTKLYILNVNNFASFDKLTNVYTRETVTTVKVVNISITSKSLFMTLCNCSLPSLSAFPSSLSNQGSTFCHCQIVISRILHKWNQTTCSLSLSFFFFFGLVSFTQHTYFDVVCSNCSFIFIAEQYSIAQL